jgi:hypothetical protein
VTQYLTEYFVDLRYLFLAHQSSAELLFDHRERCLDVAPFAVVPLKALLIVSVKVVHPSLACRRQAASSRDLNTLYRPIPHELRNSDRSPEQVVQSMGYLPHLAY